MREDWTGCILDDLLVFMTNGSSAKQFEEEVGLPISRIETIWDEKIDFERVKYIKESEPDFIKKYQILKNDILLSHINSDSHLGKTAIYKNENKVFIHGINLLKLRPSPEINADFLLHQFRFKKIKGDFIAVAQRAVNQSSINQRKLKVFDFTIAPLPEQRAIVSKIEELFSDLDKGIADLTKAQNQLKVYRQAVLKKAFEGELTKEWRAQQTNLPTADELLEQIKEERNQVEGRLKKVNSPTEEDLKELTTLPNGWKWESTAYFAKHNNNAICAGPFGTIFKAKDFRDKGIPIIFLRHVKPNNYNTKKPGFMDTKVWEKLFQSYSVFGGELLITKLGDPPGMCAIYPENIGPAMVTPDVIKMDVNESFCNKRYLMYYFNSVLSRLQYEKAAFGTTRLRVTIPIFRNLPIPFCSKEEQLQIVQEIESRLSVCDKVEQSITESLEKAKALRQSILKKAFEGTLLSEEEIATCKAAPDYEPASVLLEKIKAEKPFAKASASKGKKKI